MLAEHLKYITESAISLKDIPKDDEMQILLEKVSRLRHFRRNVNNMLLSSSNNVGFIQFDIRKFKIINDLYGEKFGDEVLYFIQGQLKDICKEECFFINLRSDVFMVVTEYEEEKELTDFIDGLDAKINMQTAITERQFMMYLQPKYSIAKNEIVGAEALVRWKHPERGMIFPNDFIPIIEENRSL